MNCTTQNVSQLRSPSFMGPGVLVVFGEKPSFDPKIYLMRHDCFSMNGFLVRKPYWLVFWLILALSSCKVPVEQNLQAIEIPVEISHQLDSLEQVMWHYYIENPDHAETLLFKTLHFLDSLNIPEKKFYVYMDFAHLYQYRKPDFFNAVSKLGKAMEIFVDYPGSYNSNCYVYIDIGNMFHYYGFYSQSIDFYRISQRFALQSGDLWGQVLAKHNIALSYQNLQLLDSASIYLKRAENLAKNDETLALILAQNYFYQADLNRVRNDSMGYTNLEKFCLASIALYEQYGRQQNSEVDEISAVTWKEIMAGNHRLLSNYYFRMGDAPLANEHLEKSLYFAELAQSGQLKAEAAMAALLMNERMLPDQALLEKINVTFEAFSQLNNLFLQKEFADSMVELSARRNIPELQTFYRHYAQHISDSITSQKLSSEFTANMMLMSRISAEYSLQRLQLLELLKTETIKNQTRIIAGITLFSLLIILLLFLFLLQKNKIDFANRAMLGRIKQDIQTTANVSVAENITRNERYDKFNKSLQNRIEKEKIFLNKDLTLHDLAVLMNTNQTYVSNYLNKIQHSNFNDFINQFRIKEACRLMLDQKNDHFTIEMLAQMSGFNSTSTFYSAFKKFTGMSPTAFKKNR